MASPSIIDPFHRALFDRIAPQIESKKDSLASGSAIDIGSYREQVGYIAGLLDILRTCVEIERERYGARPGEMADKQE